MTIQAQFAYNVIEIIKEDQNVVGLAVAGSWLINEIDQFSDLDLILVTKNKISTDKNRMLEYAKSFGAFLSGFSGDHVSEPRLLICLYDNPLLHVDIKFVTLREFGQRIETPVILFDRDEQLKKELEQTEARLVFPNYQWIEDRFWTWIHYALLKIGRGELVEAVDFFAFLRMVVFGPLLHVKNGNMPRGVRKVEMQLQTNDLDQLLSTIPSYSKASLINCLQHSITLYRKLREELFTSSVTFQEQTEEKVMIYFEEIKKQEIISV